VNISAGDAISAGVTTDGSGNFTLTITVNNGTPITVQGKTPNASLSSAEVIAEAPSSNNGLHSVLGLSNFGTVSFTGATANGTSLGVQSPDPITMVQGGTTLAQPSGISSGGDFSVGWEAASGPPGVKGHGKP
jgi:hypothetical protein